MWRRRSTASSDWCDGLAHLIASVDQTGRSGSPLRPLFLSWRVRSGPATRISPQAASAP